MSAAPPSTARVDLAITGMTCASCAARIERRLNSSTASTPRSTTPPRQATVRYDAGVAVDDARRRGRGGRLRAPAVPSTAPAAAGRGRRRPRRCGAGSSPARCSPCPSLLMAMVPALQFDDWQWLSLLAGHAGRLWGGWPFHRAAWANLRHAHRDDGHAHLARHARRLGWSLYALFLGDAGEPMRMAFELTAGDGADEIYLEVAGGRHHVHPRRALLRGPRQAPGRRGAAGAARAGRQGRRASSARRRRAPRAGRAARRRRPVRRAPGREGRHRRRRRGRARRPSTLRCSPARPCRSRSARATRSPARPSTPAAGSSCAPPGSAPTPQLAQIARLVERGPDRQGPGAAPGRPGLGRVRPGRDRARRRHAGLLARRRRERDGRRSPPRSPC